MPHSTSRLIRSSIILAALAALAAPLARGADPAESPAPVQLSAEQDHQRTMDLLNIKTLRPGADGNNAQAPNAANYDPAKANPFPSLPDPLTLKNGQKVTTADMWFNQRRPEIVEDFDREVYGRVPKDVPSVKWEVVNTFTGMNSDVPIITKQLLGHVDNSSYPLITVDIQVSLTVPANAAGPVPVIMQWGGGFGGPPGGGRGVAHGPASQPGGASGGAGIARGEAASQPGGRGFGRGNATQPGGALAGGPGAGFRGGARGAGGAAGGFNWQQRVLAKGCGYASINPASIQGQSGAGFTQGIIGLVNKGQPRKVDDWGAIRAWAWGASRAMDYFETDKSVDAKQIGLEGHSFLGKTTLVTMAYDQRFAIAYASSSGEGGAKLHRRNWGELVENLAATGEYYWMAGNFMKYAGPMNWGDLPVDSHELIAMCAPRPIFITGGQTGKGDGWVDSEGMFMATAAAGPVYKLLGKKDLGTTVFPPVETALIDGDVAFRQHDGGHTDALNWPTFLIFADRYLKVPASTK